MWSFGVPNVPCGVERLMHMEIEPFQFLVFLMYRVELKGNCKVMVPGSSCLVPNVPCGVESYIIREYNMLE